MGVGAQFPYIFDAVSRGLAVAPCRSGNVNGVGTAVYCRDADSLVFGRSQKLKPEHCYRALRAF